MGLDWQNCTMQLMFIGAIWCCWRRPAAEHHKDSLCRRYYHKAIVFSSSSARAKAATQNCGFALLIGVAYNFWGYWCIIIVQTFEFFLRYLQNKQLKKSFLWKNLSLQLHTVIYCMSVCTVSSFKEILVKYEDYKRAII